MLDASTGTTRRPSRAHGRCLRFTKMRLRRRLLPKHPPRKCLPKLVFLSANATIVLLLLWLAGLLSRNLSYVTEKTLTEATEATEAIVVTAVIGDMATDAVDTDRMKRAA